MTLPAHLVGQARKDGRTIFSMSRLRSAGSAAQPRGSSRRAKAVNFLTERGLESSKPPYASSSRSLPAASASCTTGCAENTRSAAASEASMPARSFVVGDGVCIVGERAKPTTRARLPKACGQHIALPRPKKGGVQGRSGPYPNSMPTTFANSRPKMGRIWVITSGGVKHGPTGQLAEHLAPQALRWPTRWPTPDIFCFPHRYTGVLCTSAAIIHEGWFHPAGWLLYKVRIKRAVRAEHTYSGISCGALKHRDILRGGWTINHFVHVARPLVVS